MTGRILVLGGTGAMGIYLVPALVDAGYTVDVTSRQKLESRPGVTYLQGDAQDHNFVRHLVGGNHYESIVDFMIYSTADFESRHELLLSRADQYVFVSSYRVFSDVAVITESSPHLSEVSTDAEYLSTDEYALAKSRQERVLTQSSSSNWTIVRPGITYSTGRFQLGTLEADTILSRSRRRLPVPVPAELLERRTTMTWAGDVARMLRGVIGRDECLRQQFNLTTSEHMTWREVAAIYHRHIGTEVVPIDTEDYVAAIGKPLHEYQLIYDRLVDRVLDNGKILAATGIDQASLVSLQDGLRMELERTEHPQPTLCIDIAKEARLDSLIGTCGSARGLSARDKVRYAAHRYRRQVRGGR